MALNNIDYSSKLNLSVEGMVQAFQKKAEIEQQNKLAAQKENDAAWINIAQGMSDAVSTGIENSKLKQKKDFIKTLSDSLATSAALSPKGTAQIFSNETPSLMGPRNQTTTSVPTASFNPQTADAVRAAVQVNPEEASKRYLDALIPTKPTPLALQTKSVLVDGQPTEAAFDPKSNTWYDTSSKPITGKITPYNQSQPGDITDADRKRLMPLAKAVVEGRATTGALVSARGGEKEKLSILASEIDPNFDLSLAPQRATTRKDFSSAGKSGQSLTALNTALGHLDSLIENGDKLDTKGLQAWNRVKNTALRQTGDPRVDKMLADRDAVTSELGRVFQTTGVVTQEERDTFRQRLSEASSNEQLHAVAEEWINLLKSRTDSLKANWDQTMGGVESPVPIINDKTRKILTKYGYDSKTLEKVDKQASGGDLSKLSTTDLIKMLQEDK